MDQFDNEDRFIRIIGRNGDDAFAGTDGDDALFGRGGNDTLSGGAGDDVLFGGEGEDALDGGAGDDRLAGGLGNDALSGGDGDDVLFGGEGEDALDGGAGDDVLYGGVGADVRTGGEGDDIFAFWGGDLGATDTLADFTDGEDLIDLKAFFTRLDENGAVISTAPETITVVAAGDAFDFEASPIVVVDAGETAQILLDADQDGEADLEIAIVGDADWTIDDFLLAAPAADDALLG